MHFIIVQHMYCILQVTRMIDPLFLLDFMIDDSDNNDVVDLAALIDILYSLSP